MFTPECTAVARNWRLSTRSVVNLV